MKAVNKYLGLVLTLAVMAFGGILFSNEAKAEGYTYTVKVFLADTDSDSDGSGDAGAYFLCSESDKTQLANNDAITIFGSNGNETATVEGDCLTISGLDYDSVVTINTSKLVSVTPDSDGYTKYYAKGIRQSGANDSVSTSTFRVTKDVSYVVAYGIGEIVPYKIRYVDANGNALADEETFYGPAGEPIYVSYKYIAGYVPNTYNYYTKQLVAPSTDADGNITYTTFEFLYQPGTTTSGTTETIYQGGGISYVYVTVPGTTTTVTTGAANTGNNAGANADAGVADDNADAGNDANGDNTTIDDEETPTNGPEDVISIDDEPTAKSGGNEDSAFPVFAWIIAAAAAVAVIVAVTILARKKKAKKNIKVSDNEDKADK